MSQSGVDSDVSGIVGGRGWQGERYKLKVLQEQETGWHEKTIHQLVMNTASR